MPVSQTLEGVMLYIFRLIITVIYSILAVYSAPFTAFSARVTRNMWPLWAYVWSSCAAVRPES